MTDLPEAAYAATLAGLDRMSSGRLRILIDDHLPSVACAMIRGEIEPTGLIRPLFDTAGLLGAWREGLARRSPEAIWARCLELGITVATRDAPAYPPALVNDQAPAPVLFLRGSFAELHGRRVGMVGTRNATASGRDMAVGLGADLAREGVHVVSGLARGIDGWAHRGVLSVSGAAPIGVVASGLDVVYPREHARLWDEVAERGVLVSEAAPGTPPETFRFPLRNRIIAGLARCWSWSSPARPAAPSSPSARRGPGDVLVMAVPGAINNRAARGTNDLLRDGCPIVTDVDDVLIALGLDTRRTGAVAYDPRPRPDRPDREMLAMCCEPRTLDQLMLLTSRSLVECAMSMARLEAQGWVHQVNGWFEAVGATAHVP